MKPYIAIDIETTGLAHNSHVLQIAAIAVTDGVEYKFNVLLKHPVIYWGEPVALGMNAWLLKEIAAKESDYLVQSPHDAFAGFAQFLKIHAHNGTVTLAGKNVAGFDLPILKNNDHFEALKSVKISHRVIDVGSLYLPDFGYVPTLTEVNTLLGRSPVSHNALDDCLDVIAAISHKESLNKEVQKS